MELTGKCKEDFEKWFPDKTFGAMPFYQYHESLKWGVYIDFFDSKGYFITQDSTYEDRGVDHEYYITSHAHYEYSKPFPSRAMAREDAIRVMNKIYNSQK